MSFCQLPPYYKFPENRFNTLMSELFLDEETADVLFEVGESEHKRQFFAHYIVLKKCAPELASMCEGRDKLEPLHFPDVHPDIFHELLRYVYGGAVAVDKWVSHHQDFIDAADKFGVISLKLEAETRLVQGFKFSVNNVVDMILYAESKNCTLLKEQAVSFISANTGEVFNSDSFKSFPRTESIVKEIFSFAAMCLAESKNHQNRQNRQRFPSPLRDLPVATLRTKLSEKRLDIDGSREVLIARLENEGKGK